MVPRLVPRITIEFNFHKRNIMAINRITPLAFKHIKPSDIAQQIPDGGNLYVRVRTISDGGAISFRFRYRFNDKQKWLTLKSKKLSDARLERDTYANLLKTGVDPSLERTLQINRTKQKQINEQALIDALNARITVNDLFLRWRDVSLINRKDISEIIRMFEKDVLPLLGNFFVEDVKKTDVMNVIDPILQRGVNRMAKTIFGLVRQMFRFAVDRDIIEFDPTANIRKANIGTKDVERDRTLSDDELNELIVQLPTANLLKSTECAIWIILSTTCRVGELSQAKYSDINFTLKTWRIPAENSKNKKALLIYLSDFAVMQLKILSDLSLSKIWLFPNRTDTSHVYLKSITKQIGDRQSINILSNRSKNNKSLILSGGKWTPHDLRRTAATMMGDLEVNSDVIEKCLNHTEENKMKRTYQKQKLEDQKLNAWRLLGDKMHFLYDKSANVPQNASADSTLDDEEEVNSLERFLK